MRGNRETRKNEESAVNDLRKRRRGGGDGAPVKVNTTHVSFSFRFFFSHLMPSKINHFPFVFYKKKRKLPRIYLER